MLIQTAFNFSSVVQRWVCRFSGLRLVASRWFVVFLAYGPCVASVSSYCFRSFVPPRWHRAFSQFVPVAKFRLSLDVTVPQRHLRAVFQWKFIMQVMPIAKNGTCPTGYSAQGNMCVPNANAKPAIPKNGTCPTGWSAQGNYCVANSNNPKTVIPKNGTCPTGYSAQGNYCVSNK